MSGVRLGWVGAGQMATALARGLVAAGRLSESEMAACDPSPAAREAFLRAMPQVQWADSNEQLAAAAEVLVLAVKPQHMASVTAGLRGHVANKLVVSIAAGITLDDLAEQLDSGRLIRVMPNTPALVGRGAAGMALGRAARAQDEQFVREMMSAVGLVHVVAEPLLDAVTGLSGSGPAFVAILLEALADGGVRAGLPRRVALELAAQTVAGTAEMVLRSGRHPAVLKDEVASPGGTTIAGLHVLEQAGVRGAVMSAVVAAAERARELARGQ